MGSAADDDGAVVIVGASVAGVRCATALRDLGFEGAVVLLDAETGDPYDKPQLSKRFHDEHELELLAEGSALRERGIDYRTGVTATGLDLALRQLETSHGPIAFDELVIATGCEPRTVPYALPASAGYVRTRQDGERLTAAVQRGGRLVVLGGGFLGLEAAAAAVGRGMAASVVDVAPQVLGRGIPASAAALIAAKHRREGVELRLGAVDPVLEQVEGGVRIGDVVGDYAVVSIGAVPRVDWLADSGLSIDDGVVCQATLSAAPGVWAVGDCVRWFNARNGRAERHEHWTTAVRHGQHVAASIAGGTASPLSEVSYVWSDQFEWRIQSVGRVGGEEIHFAGRPDEHVVVCVTGGRVTGVTTINSPARCLRARQLLQGEDPPVEVVVEKLGLAGFTRVE